MKTIKKLVIFTFAVLLATVSLAPSTYSWYPHSGSESGKAINYSDNIPLSVKSAVSTVSMTTYKADANGILIKDNNDQPIPASNVSLPANSQKAVQYYKTTFTNSGSNDVFVDLIAKTMPNNADFYIGTTLPTVNEKAYASRAVRTKVTANTVRVYFKTHSSMASYWSKDNYNLRLVNEKGTYQIDGSGNLTDTQYTSDNNAAGSAYQQSNTDGTNNDINISFTVNGKEYQAKMLKCPTNDTSPYADNTSSPYVFYYDIPTNSSSFFFFNHWYLRSSTNREWNRTIDITDLTAGKLYYLDNGKVDDKYKSYTARPVDTELVAVNSYYTYVRMSVGNSAFADISLKKVSDEEGFIPEYYGSSLTYSSASPSVATVNIDGLVTPVAQGSTTVTTRVTGRYGDYKDLVTSVNIPASITDVPIITNVKVPAAESGTAGKVEVDWYALNKSSSATMTAGDIYYTL